VLIQNKLNYCQRQNTVVTMTATLTAFLQTVNCQRVWGPWPRPPRDPPLLIECLLHCRFTAARVQGRRRRLFAVYRRWHSRHRVDVSHGQVLGDTPDDAAQQCCCLRCQDYLDIVLFIVIASHNHPTFSLKCDQLTLLPCGLMASKVYLKVYR